MPDDPKEAATVIADLVWALGATGKFVWPIPDKGLKKRMHRIKAETLIVWGEDDALVSSVYAEEFAARIANSRVEIIKDCGHVPQVERLESRKADGGELSRRMIKRNVLAVELRHRALLFEAC